MQARLCAHKTRRGAPTYWKQRLSARAGRAATLRELHERVLSHRTDRDPHAKIGCLIVSEVTNFGHSHVHIQDHYVPDGSVQGVGVDLISGFKTLRTAQWACEPAAFININSYPLPGLDRTTTNQRPSGPSALTGNSTNSP